MEYSYAKIFYWLTINNRAIYKNSQSDAISSRGEGNKTKGTYFQIPHSENWFYVRDEGQEDSGNCEYNFSEAAFQKMTVEKMETKGWFPCEKYARYLSAIWEARLEDGGDITYIHSDILSGIQK